MVDRLVLQLSWGNAIWTPGQVSCGDVVEKSEQTIQQKAQTLPDHCKCKPPVLAAGSSPSPASMHQVRQQQLKQVRVQEHTPVLEEAIAYLAARLGLLHALYCNPYKVCPHIRAPLHLRGSKGMEWEMDIECCTAWSEPLPGSISGLSSCQSNLHTTAGCSWSYKVQ